jgi:hypothetical protein
MKQTAPFTKSLELDGGFSKITDKVTQFAAVSSAILAVVSGIMKKTLPITWLWTICEVIFAQAIFGAEITAKVLKEVYQKYFFKEQSSVGGLNYNGLGWSQLQWTGNTDML